MIGFPKHFLLLLPGDFRDQKRGPNNNVDYETLHNQWRYNVYESLWIIITMPSLFIHFYYLAYVYFPSSRDKETVKNELFVSAP